MSNIRTVNVDSPVDKYHKNANYPEDKNNDIPKEMDVDMEAISVDGNKGEEVVKLINYLLSLLANGVNLTDKNGTNIDKETLTNFLASLSSPNDSKSNAGNDSKSNAGNDTKSNAPSTTLSELPDTALQKDQEGKIKNQDQDKENVDVLQIKPDSQTQKESNIGKSLIIQNKETVQESATNKLQTESSSKNGNEKKVTLNFNEGTVQVTSQNGALSTNDGVIVGVRGNPMFLDSSNEFANDSGFKDSNQSGDQGRQDDRENEPFDAIYEPGD